MISLDVQLVVAMLAEFATQTKTCRERREDYIESKTLHARSCFLCILVYAGFLYVSLLKL